MENASDDLKLNGVVYNEMKGAFSSPDDVLDREIVRNPCSLIRFMRTNPAATRM